ncbi:MAG: MOSC domain-containing protein [Hyphomicrobium sp.]|nr:MOSC domain-containing protein [Hyphomicrobium sp.]
MMQLSAIYRYPVKSLRGHALPISEVEPIGLAGDRRWLVVDPAGKAVTIRDIPKMVEIEAEVTDDGLRLSHATHGTCVVPSPGPASRSETVNVWSDSVAARAAGLEASTYLSSILGHDVSLVHLADVTARPITDEAAGGAALHVSFADAYPVLLATTASVEDLGRRLGYDVSVRAFRPNLVISGSAPWAEDTWRVIRVGGVTFRIAKPCDRCVVTTCDPDTGAQRDPTEPLRTLGKFHRAADGGIIFGQNALPESTGIVRVGDAVEIVETGQSNLGI